jgi:branched-chain amino acid transport system permease protein
MAAGELLRWGYIHASGLTGGSTGMAVPAPTVFGISLGSQASLYYGFLVVAILLIAGTRNLLRSRVGRALVAVRENELAAAALAIPTARVITLAFAWSGLIVGIAGCLFAVLIGRVLPNSFTLGQLAEQFAFVMVGGVGTLAGPILGAVLLASEPELLRAWPGTEEMLFGLLLVAVIAIQPGGIMGLLVRVFPSLRQTFYRRPARHNS